MFTGLVSDIAQSKDAALIQFKFRAISRMSTQWVVTFPASAGTKITDVIIRSSKATLTFIKKCQRHVFLLNSWFSFSIPAVLNFFYRSFSSRSFSYPSCTNAISGFPPSFFKMDPFFEGRKWEIRIVIRWEVRCLLFSILGANFFRFSLHGNESLPEIWGTQGMLPETYPWKLLQNLILGIWIQIVWLNNRLAEISGVKLSSFRVSLWRKLHFGILSL